MWRDEQPLVARNAEQQLVVPVAADQNFVYSSAALAMPPSGPAHVRRERKNTSHCLQRKGRTCRRHYYPHIADTALFSAESGLTLVQAKLAKSSVDKSAVHFSLGVLQVHAMPDCAAHAHHVHKSTNHDV